MPTTQRNWLQVCGIGCADWEYFISGFWGGTMHCAERIHPVEGHIYVRVGLEYGKPSHQLLCLDTTTQYLNAFLCGTAQLSKEVLISM